MCLESTRFIKDLLFHCKISHICCTSFKAIKAFITLVFYMFVVKFENTFSNATTNLQQNKWYVHFRQHFKMFRLQLQRHVCLRFVVCFFFTKRDFDEFAKTKQK